MQLEALFINGDISVISDVFLLLAFGQCHGLCSEIQKYSPENEGKEGRFHSAKSSKVNLKQR